MKLYVIAILCISSSVEFNLDTKFPIVFNGKEKSYFGYSVAMKNNHGSTGGTPTILISATRANSSVATNVVEPGVLFNCDLFNKVCSEISMQPKGEKIYLPDDYMWLGMSLDVSPQKIITCAPRWRNKSLKNLYPGNGMCYVLDERQTTTEQLVPFDDITKQVQASPKRYYYAFGQSGISMQFSQYSNHILLGSPGFSNWTGTVVTYMYAYENADQKVTKQHQIPLFPNKIADEDYRYVGYSVTSGRFFERGEIWFVAGAPRDNFYRGRVYIYQLSKGTIFPRVNVKVQQEGEQMGEYFGAAVLGVDLNNDNYTDLLVGAPLYSNIIKNGPNDYGRVDLFESNRVGLQKKGSIYGLRKDGARFGSAIVNLGDLNLDGFNDIAVGAPYEDSAGAVYIYHGSVTGLNKDYAQRIAAADVNSNVNGFGISMSRGIDIDSNHYPDLLVGAYNSSQAILFRSRPVVEIEAILKPDVNQIDVTSSSCSPQSNVLGQSCFRLDYCFSYQGKYLPQFLDVLITMEIENGQRSQNKIARGCFRGNNNLCTFRLQQTIRITQKNSCQSAHVYIQAGASEYRSPLQLQLNYSFDANTQDFCKECPVQQLGNANHIQKQVPFTINCGSRECISDLNLQAKILELRYKEMLIVGIDTRATLEVLLKNSGDPAYFSFVSIRLPPDIVVINSAFCTLHMHDRGTDLECETGNPLQGDQQVLFQVKLDLSAISTDTKILNIELETRTVSQDKNTGDNRVQLKIPCESRYRILLNGIVDPGLLFYNEETFHVVPFTQKYEVSSLYSPISKMSLRFSLPIAAKHNHTLIVFNVTTVQASGTAVCFEDYDELHNVQKDEVTPKTDANYLVNCQTHQCRTIECSAGPVGRTDKASVTISGFLNVTAVRIGTHNSTEEIHITSEGIAIGENEETAKIAVIVKLVKEGPVASKSVPLWVIILSAVLGLIILVAITAILAKRGFFKRVKKEELEEIKRDSKLLQNPR